MTARAGMGADAADFLLATYRRHSADDASLRLPPFLLAYAIFRTAYCKMAAAAMSGAPEEARLRRDYARYREQASRLLAAYSRKSAASTGTAA